MDSVMIYAYCIGFIFEILIIASLKGIVYQIVGKLKFNVLFFEALVTSLAINITYLILIGFLYLMDPILGVLFGIVLSFLWYYIFLKRKKNTLNKLGIFTGEYFFLVELVVAIISYFGGIFIALFLLGVK